MRKVILATILTLSFTVQAFALEGEMGYFGGISTGTKLPTTTEIAQKNAKKKTSKQSLPYKEHIYLNGKAELVEGTIEIRPSGEVDPAKPVGSYKETYIVKAQNSDGSNVLNRTLTLDTKYVYDAQYRQATKTSVVSKWSETIIVGGQMYTLDSKQSHFNKSILEDYTPGVMYYRGDLNYRAVYMTEGEDEGNQTSVAVNGPIYGYDQAWAKTETQKLNIIVNNGGRQYHIEQNPSLTVSKTLQYGANEPDAISFQGNYKELTKNEGMALYHIRVGAKDLYEEETQGGLHMPDNTSIEQLIAPYISRIQGHFAESDIKKLYSMGIYTGPTSTFNPNQVITRGEYIKALVLAMKIPIEEVKVTKKKTSKKTDVAPIFLNLAETDAYYPYALAAYNAGLISGGVFSKDEAMTRELAYALVVRMIGLERLGFYGQIYTPFVDDNKISSWAKGSIQAGVSLGLIRPDENGYFLPQRKVTKAEAAAITNQMIDYLRYTLKIDYQEKIMQ
ncbi:MAG TPA: S-layer homology domain-containing protein [Epulopiscium sp.]|nr:S-layer homology domain-containing protein [Candidatus Epulonipiscium sp.]